MSKFLIAQLTIPEVETPGVNDVLYVYWDDEAVDFSCRMILGTDPPTVEEDVTSGDDETFISSRVSGMSYQGADMLSYYTFCNGTTQVTFRLDLGISTSFPYVHEVDIPDAIACATDPIVCDVAFDGPATVTKATNEFAEDGSAQVSASGTNGTIKYSFNVSPSETGGDYASLSNTTGLFDDILPGTYNTYALDPVGCWDVLSIVVGFSIPYFAKYRVQYADQEFDHRSNITSTVEILEREYPGDVIDATGAEIPFQLFKNSGEINNKFTVIRPTYATINLTSESDSQFRNIFSQDDRKFKVSWVHGSESWYGFIKPSIYSENYKSAPYETSVTAIDGLETLSQIDFLDSGLNLIRGTLSHINIISIVLAKLGLELDILSGINKFSDTMATASTDDPLAQAYINCETFLDADANPVKCSEVLETILGPYGAFITQCDGRWNILEVDGRVNGYNWRLFDELGVYQSHGSTNPVISIVDPTQTLDVFFKDKDQQLEIVPAYGKITITHVLKLKESIFPLSLDEWQVNSSSSGTGIPYAVENSLNKGIIFSNLGTGTVALLSPLLTTKSLNDSVNISFNYLIIMKVFATIGDPNTNRAYNANQAPNPPWIKVSWRLLLRSGVTDYYYHEGIGWNRLASIGSSTTSVATPTSHLTSKTLTIQTGLTIPSGVPLKIEHDSTHFFRANVTSYNPSNGQLICLSTSNVGTGTFTSWTVYQAGLEFQTNSIFATEYNGDFKNFNKDIVLPVFSSLTDISLQLQIIFQSEIYSDFVDATTLKAIPTAIYPEGYFITGKNPNGVTDTRPRSGTFQTVNDRAWYKLRVGDDADSSPDIFRGTDFNSTSNKVVWDDADYKTVGFIDRFVYVNAIDYIKLKEVIVKFYPAGNKPLDTETIDYTINDDYKEDLPVDILAGDQPSTIPQKEIYLNYFRTSDGEVTKNWTRPYIDSDPAQSLQELLLTSIINQHSKPTWKLSGSFVGESIKFNSIIKHTIRASDILGTGNFTSGATVFDETFGASLGTFSDVAPGDVPWVWDAGHSGSAYMNNAFGGTSDLLQRVVAITAGLSYQVTIHYANTVNQVTVKTYFGATLVNTQVLSNTSGTDLSFSFTCEATTSETSLSITATDALGSSETYIGEVKLETGSLATLANTEFTSTGSDWLQSTSATAWSIGSGAAVVVLSGAVNAKRVMQYKTIPAGARMKVKTYITGYSSSGTRVDKFYIVLMKAGSVVQMVLVTNLIASGNTDSTTIFSVDGAADSIGFVILRAHGSADRSYSLDYFRLTVLTSVKYFESNSYARDDRHNFYRNELVQLIPAILSGDATIDDAN